MQGMAVYRLVPSAAPHDLGWKRAANRGEVVVRARSSGDARVVAAQAECETGRAGLFTTRMKASAFMDEKLYAVRRAPPGRHAGDGPRQVLEGFGAEA